MSTARRPLRAVVVGAGLMGRWHADAVVRAGGRIAAFVDVSAQRARAQARAYPGALALDGLESALAAAPADVVHVCTPTDTHERLVRQALQAGCHVLVEKPLAPDPAVTEGLLRLADSRQLLLCPVHQFLFQPGVLRLQTALQGLGPVRHIDTVACSAGAEETDDDTRDRIAAEILPHPLSLFVRLLSPGIARIPWHVARPIPGELCATAEFRGASLGILISTRGRPTANTLHLIAERGSACVDLFHGFCVVERAGVSRTRKILHPFSSSAMSFFIALFNLTRRTLHWELAYPGLRELISRFYAAILDGAPAPITPHEALAVATARHAFLSGRRGTAP